MEAINLRVHFEFQGCKIRLRIRGGKGGKGGKGNGKKNAGRLQNMCGKDRKGDYRRMQEEYGHNMAYYMEIRTETQQQKKDIHKPCVTKNQRNSHCNCYITTVTRWTIVVTTTCCLITFKSDDLNLKEKRSSAALLCTWHETYETTFRLSWFRAQGRVYTGPLAAKILFKVQEAKHKKTSGEMVFPNKERMHCFRYTPQQSHCF